MLNGMQWVCFNTVATTSAIIFYLSLLLLIFFPVVRSYFVNFFFLTNSSSPHQIAPLDSLRGAAAAMVAMAHIWNFCTPIFNATQTEWWWSLAVLGNKAVPIFVILSGFLIYRSVRKIINMDELRCYVMRRFLRIYPVYIFTVTLGFIFGQSASTLPNILSNLFMVRTITQAYLSFVNPPFWSIYVEVLFYFLLPIWVIMFKSRVVLVASLSFIILLIVDQLGSRELWIFKYFFVGILISELTFSKERFNLSEKQAVILFLSGIVLLIIDFKVDQTGAMYDWFNYFGFIPKNQAGYTIGLAIGMAFLLVGILYSQQVIKILGIKHLRFLGTISYSLYCIHPFFILAVFPSFRMELVGQTQQLIAPLVHTPAWYLPFVMFPGCLVWATLCFIFVERPFLLKMKRLNQSGASDSIFWGTFASRQVSSRG